jgi:predicted flap endonuclease-1-like 5' DNA nuclease
MIYLIEQLWLWLLLTAGFAAFAGWSLAAARAAPDDHELIRDREHLTRDLARLASGEGDNGAGALEGARGDDALRRALQLRDGRIAELEHALSAARARVDDSASRIAELERAAPPGPAEHEEVGRLRALVAQHDQARALEVEIAAEPAAEDESMALQVWRLRYFEQRVRYLEGKAAARPAAPLHGAGPDEPPLIEWRAREAEARAFHLEQEMRALAAAPSVEPVEAAASPFAADAEVDVLLRWRLLYLERRVAHLQEQAQAAPASGPSADPDRWKWRARYLEARLRHLEQRSAAQVEQCAPGPAVAAPLAEEVPPRPAGAAVRGEKPPVLPAARNGAADDFTLIEDVSVLQQTTLYALGIFHFDQVAGWTPAHVAWVDQYLRLRGRIEDEEWVEQAGDLAHGGVAAARQIRDSENA